MGQSRSRRHGPAGEAAPCEEPKPAAEPRYVSQSQIGLLMQACHDCDVTEEQLKVYLGETYQIKTRKHIPADLLDTILEWVSTQAPEAK